MSPSFFTIILLSLFSTPCNAQTSYSLNLNTNSHPCPPFPSIPHYPFSSFHLTCSTPHSQISINNNSFNILSFNPNTSSITLSPHNNSTSKQHPTKCPNNNNFPSIPTHPINLSSTPFHISTTTCSRLSFLRPCSPPSLPNCSHCPFLCHLIQNPSHLLPDCASTTHHHSPSDSDDHSCQTDILGFLDQLLGTGIQLIWDPSLDPTTFRFHPQPTLSPPWLRKFKPSKLAILATIVTLTSLLLLISVTTAILRHGTRSNSSSPTQDPTTLFLRNHTAASLLPPVFTFEALALSTNNFDPKRKLGDGGFGSVYLAHLRDGRLAAVKYLHRHHAVSSSTKSFCNEILILSSINHPNLVKLHGYCSDPRGLLLVYDYVPNGTLAEHLHHRKGSLTWLVRLEIALQTALAMEYLHFSVAPPIVHRDITSSNIFVERDMRIKVGDFGLSRLLVVQDNTTSSSNGFVWTGPQGTPGYLDPDYHRSFRLTEKSDVYSFGVVLLELISGMRAVDQSRDKREMALADLVVSRIQMGQLHQVLDPVLDGGDTVAAVAELAFRCVAADKDDRPDAREVVEELKRVRNRTVTTAKD